MGRGGGVLHAAANLLPAQITAVAACGGDHDAGMVERFTLRRRFAPAPRVRDLSRTDAPAAARARSHPLSCFQARISTVFCLHEHDVAVLADRVGHLDVERHLQGPPIGFFHRFARRFAFVSGGSRVFAQQFGCMSFLTAARKRQFPSFTLLVDLFETAVGGAACGQLEFFVVDPQIGFRPQVVVRIHDRDRLRLRGGRPRFFARKVRVSQLLAVPDHRHPGQRCPP